MCKISVIPATRLSKSWDSPDSNFCKQNRECIILDS